MLTYAGIRYFGTWGWLIGPGVGIVVSLSLAVSSARISDIAQKRQRLAKAMYYALFALSPSVVVLSIFAPLTIWAAIAWASAPDLAIGLVGAVVGGSLIASNKPAEPAKKRTKPAKSQTEPTVEPAKPAFVCSVAGCKAKPFGSQSALNAHQRKHKKIAGYAVSFEPIKQDEISQGKL